MSKFNIKMDKAGAVAETVHIEGGQHIYQAEVSPGGKPMQRPPQVEHFTGRKDDLNRLLADLQPGRVVTLWGPGGIGKTALAAHALWRLAPDNEPPALFPDGIVYHSFYNQPQADLALEAIVRAYGDEPRPTPRDAALRVLSGKCALLLLDGTEAADDLSVVLKARGNCGVLITSRSRKDVIDDRREVLPLESDEATALLRSWGKEQAADTDSAQRICEFVGRLPLAVRLVGRYLEQTGEAAADYLAWLQQTPLDALDHGEHRHDSVALLLARSLDEVSNLACKMLSTVGFLALRPISGQRLAAGMGLSANDLRQPLNELFNFGLLLRQGDVYEVSHALVHTYAREKVPASIDTVRNLAAYYNEFTRDHRSEGVAGYARLDPERDHILRVLSGCMELEEWGPAQKLAWAIVGYLDVQGHSTERLLVNQTGLDIARRTKDRREEGAWLGNLGNAYSALGEVDQAVDYYKQSLVIHREIGSRQGEANALGNLGNAYSALGEVDQAVDYYKQSLVIHREIGYRQGEAIQLGNLGLAYSALGEVDQAVDYYKQSLVIDREIGYRQGEATQLGNLGLAYSALGEIDQAVDYHKQVLVIDREIGYRQGEAIQLCSLGLAYHALGEVDQAVDYHKQALVIHREIGYRQGEAETLGNLGLVYHALGEVDQAVDYLKQALVIFEEIKSPYADRARNSIAMLTGKSKQK